MDSRQAMTAIRSRRRHLAMLGALIFSLILAIGPWTVLAIHDEGIVELDGNTDDAGPLAGADWDSLFDADGDYTGPGGLTPSFRADYQTPDFTYHAGSDKDQDDVGTWKCGDVNTPTPKDEILNAYAVLATSAGSAHSDAGDLLLFFGFERPVNTGTSFMGVWFMQDSVSCDSAPSGATIDFTGDHTPGDILTLVNFVNGGASFQIQVYSWVGSGGDTAGGVLDLITTTGECSGTTVDACGKVNQAPITTNWPPGDTSLAAHQFFEGGINVSALLDTQETPCFSTFMAETRTSAVFTAQLKDYAFGELANCGGIEINKTAKHADSGSDPNLVATFEIKQGDTVVATVVTDADGFACVDALSPGSYTVHESIPPAGYSAADDVNVDVASGKCDDGTATVVPIENTPLTDITVTVDSQVDGGTSSTIDCEPTPDDPDATTDADGDGSFAMTDLEPGTYTCTIVVDP
jgi:hypothetical protein